MKETFSFGQYLKHGLRQEEAHDARGKYAWGETEQEHHEHETDAGDKAEANTSLAGAQKKGS